VSLPPRVIQGPHTNKTLVAAAPLVEACASEDGGRAAFHGGFRVLGGGSPQSLMHSWVASWREAAGPGELWRRGLAILLVGCGVGGTTAGENQALTSVMADDGDVFAPYLV
jgi:hypothetical protein